MNQNEIISKLNLKIENQIQKFKNEKFVIYNEEICKKFLKHNNYYTLCLFKKIKIKDKKSLENLIELYNLDMKIRKILLYILEVIETKLKMEIVYYHTIKYGELGYLNSNFFDNELHHKEFIDKIFKNKDFKNLSMNYENNCKIFHNNFIVKNLINSHKKTCVLSFSKIINFLSFGALSKFYSNMPTIDKKEFKNQFYTDIDIKILKSWFVFLVEIRNSCAHGMPFLVKIIKFPPKKLKTQEWDNIKNEDIKILFLVLKAVLNDEEIFFKFKKELIQLLNSFENINFFPILMEMKTFIENIDNRKR